MNSSSTTKKKRTTWRYAGEQRQFHQTPHPWHDNSRKTPHKHEASLRRGWGPCLDQAFLTLRPALERGDSKKSDFENHGEGKICLLLPG